MAKTWLTTPVTEVTKRMSDEDDLDIGTYQTRYCCKFTICLVNSLGRRTANRTLWLLILSLATYCGWVKNAITTEVNFNSCRLSGNYGVWHNKSRLQSISLQSVCSTLHPPEWTSPLVRIHVWEKWNNETIVGDVVSLCRGNPTWSLSGTSWNRWIQQSHIWKRWNFQIARVDGAYKGT